MRLKLSHPTPWRAIPSDDPSRKGEWIVNDASNVLVANYMQEAEARLLVEAPNMLHFLEECLRDRSFILYCDYLEKLARQCAKRVRSPVGGRAAGAKGG